MTQKVLFIILFAILIINPSFASAQDDSLALTIIPTLMKINMEPGESIATTIKVVNNNSAATTFYAKVWDFEDNGSGQIRFLNNGNIADTEENKSVYLSKWVTLSQEKMEIAAFSKAMVPFTIDVPQNAQPGGHYAAILIGTNPPDEAAKGAEIKVSSYISSLLLIRITGAIEEKGMIREFNFSQRFYRGGEGNFHVRFENSGNVHLQPQGDIKIYDMFGKQKGDIPVNVTQDASGNVLPKSIRSWDDLKWAGEDFFIFNRYKAELSLSYGEEAKQTEYQTFFFWGVNLRALAIIGGALLLLFLLLLVFIKFYIGQSVRNLERQFKTAGIKKKQRERGVVKKEIEKPAAIKKSEEKKIIDLRKRK